jgi:methionyl-tRNA synthetase
MDQALELLPADCWRWYLVANAPEGSDVSFTWEHFQATVNKDLADVLGNFVNRVFRFSASRFGDAVPRGGSWGPKEDSLAELLGERIAAYEEQLLGLQFRRASATLRSIWAAGNEYVDAAAPWTVFRNDPEQAAAIVRVAFNLIKIIAIISAPIVPDASARILRALGLPSTPEWLSDAASGELRSLEGGHLLQAPDVLFRKIEDTQVEEWKARFGGPQQAA